MLISSVTPTDNTHAYTHTHMSVSMHVCLHIYIIISLKSFNFVTYIFLRNKYGITLCSACDYIIFFLIINLILIAKSFIREENVAYSQIVQQPKEWLRIEWNGIIVIRLDLD